MRRGFPITQTMRLERRARAEARNKEYNEKYPTAQAKLEALPATGASKQRAKLQALVNAEHDKKELSKFAASVKVSKSEKVEDKELVAERKRSLNAAKRQEKVLSKYNSEE